MSARTPRRAGPGNRTEFIDEIIAGRWIDPQTGQAARVPYDAIAIRVRFRAAAGGVMPRARRTACGGP